METPVISYVTGLPVFITIDADGNLTVTVDLSEAATDIQFEGTNAYLDDEPVDEYEGHVYARIERVLKRANYEATVTFPAPSYKATATIPALGEDN